MSYSFAYNTALKNAKAFRRQWLDMIKDGKASQLDCLSVELAYRDAKLQSVLIQIAHIEESDNDLLKAWLPCAISKRERYTRQRNEVRAAFLEEQQAAWMEAQEKDMQQEQAHSDTLPQEFVMATAYRANLAPEQNAARQHVFMGQLNEASEVYGSIVNAGVGSWQGVQENSLCIEVTSSHPADTGDKIICLSDLAQEWGQDAILFVGRDRGAWLVTKNDHGITDTDYIGNWIEVQEKEAKACEGWTAMYDLQDDCMRYYIVK